jgi:hypothetical protein
VHPEVRSRGETFRMYLLHLGSMRNEVAALWRRVKMVSMREKERMPQSGGE